ncbi:hypothetical protein Alg130_07626 [Pyrenophora tritici-repentis]|nr:hypothetical protein Alg130_07626 [Pyrenophora tritici-repentis]
MASPAPSISIRANRKDGPVYIQLLTSPSFFTAGDLIKGNLLVTPTSRPIHISVGLLGSCTIQDGNAGNVRVDFLHHSQHVFISRTSSQNFELLPKSTKSPGKVELPFSLIVPHHATLSPPSDRTWFYSKDSYNHPRFQHSPGFPLPPSCTGNTHSSPRVIYHLEAYMESHTPGSQLLKIREEIKYLPPAPQYHPALLQPDLNFGTRLPKHYSREKFIRSRRLFPNYDEHNGKLGKIKDKLVDKELLFGLQSFAEVPYVKFNLFATPASVLVIGKRVPVVITVQHLKRSESLANPPELFLRRIKVQLLSAYNTFVPTEILARRNSQEYLHTERDTITLCDKKFEKGNGEPLFDRMNLLDVADVKLIHDKVIPSFTSYGLNLEHELQIEVYGRCADRDFQGIACTQPVQVVTDWQACTVLEDVGSWPVYQELDRTTHSREVDTTTDLQELDEMAPPYQLHSRHMAPFIADSVPPPEYDG